MSDHKRPFGRDDALARAAEYINRAENALEVASGPQRDDPDDDLDVSDALPFAQAAAAIATALIAYAEADGPPVPLLE